MAICGDCIHFDLCEMMYSRIPEIDGCDYFKDHSRFVELPCKIGNKLYLSTESINKIIHLLSTYVSSPELFEIVPEKQIKQALAEQEQRNNTN